MPCSTVQNASDIAPLAHSPQASRALVNLWADGKVPEVVPSLADNGPARPELAPGRCLFHHFEGLRESSLNY